MSRSEKKRYATFTLDGVLFGVEVENVQEVLRHQEMTSVPLAPDTVRGLINLRGQIVTALDLRKRFGLPSAGSGIDPTNLVVRDADGPISLLVDEVGDVTEVEAAAYEEPPPNLSSDYRQMITGVYKLADRLLLVLDTQSALSCEDSTVPALM